MLKPDARQSAGGGLHENLTRADDVVIGSDRNFGLTWAVVMGVVGAWPLIHGMAPRLWAMIPAGMFLLAAFACPKILAPLKVVWFRVGLVLHHIVTPIVMGLIFYLAVTPTGLILRAMGRDPLRLKKDPSAPSYWIVRDPPGPPPGSLRNQF